MNDLISRQAVIDLFPNDALEWDTNGGYIAPHFARRMIEELPPAQPVRHGKWIRDEFGTWCSACGSYAYRDKFDRPWESPYCPICGAKMDGERKEE